MQKKHENQISEGPKSRLKHGDSLTLANAVASSRSAFLSAVGSDSRTALILSLSLLVNAFALINASGILNLAETMSPTSASMDSQMEGAMSTATFIASMASLSKSVLELEGGSCIGCRDGMEGEEAVDDDDEAKRDDCEFCRECSPHDLLYPDIPELIDRFGVFRDGRRGVTGSGSTYDGSIFPISTSLELNEPACLRIILVLSLSSPGDCAE